MFSILLFIACPAPVDPCTAAPEHSFSDLCVRRSGDQCYDPVLEPKIGLNPYISVDRFLSGIQRVREGSSTSTCRHYILEYCDPDTVVIGSYNDAPDELMQGEMLQVVKLDNTRVGSFEFYAPMEEEVLPKGICKEVYLGAPAYESCAREAAKYILDTRFECSDAIDTTCDLDACNRINFP